MPRYYCDYCDTYLTHDSPSVRKQHNAGYKHKANVRSYYQQFEEQQTQSLIDQRVKEHLGQTAAFQQQVGAAFQQHLAALQSGQRPRLPVLPPPTLPVPGSTQLLNSQSFVPPLHPPVLPRPTTGPPAYGASMGPPPMLMGPPPMLRPPGAPVSSTPGMSQSSSLPRPPSLTPLVTTGVKPSTPTSSPMANGGMPLPSISSASGMYQNQQPNSVPTSGAYGSYNYAAAPTSYSQQSTSAGLPNYAVQQPPRVSTLSASSALSTPLTPPSAGNSDGYMYSQGPTTASRGN